MSIGYIYGLYLIFIFLIFLFHIFIFFSFQWWLCHHNPDKEDYICVARYIVAKYPFLNRLTAIIT